MIEQLNTENEETKTIPAIPSMGSKDWNVWAMSHFTDDELVDGNPTVDGLRRVVHLLVGEIINVHVQVVQVPVFDNNNRATALVAVTVRKHNYKENDIYDDIIVTTDAADADALNMDGDFLKYPTAVAVTRAEARALRKLLKIKKPAAEEISNQDDFDGDENITKTQVSTINHLCARLNVNVSKFVGQSKRGLKTLDEATYLEGMAMLQLLSKYQANKDNIPKAILV